MNKKIFIFVFNLNLILLLSLQIFAKDFTFIFISSSMPKQSIQKLLKQVNYYVMKKHKKVEIFIGGLINESLKNTINYIYPLMKKNNLKYGITIYPQLFEKYKIKVVPTFVRLIDNKVIVMTGDVGLDYFFDKSQDTILINNSNFINLGCFGHVYKIVEKSLKQIITEKLDKDKIRKIISNAQKKLFTNIQTVNLPPAKKSYSYLVDLSIKFDHDIFDSNGRLIYQKGTVLNPLAKIKYNKKIILFNARDNNQLKFVKKTLKNSKKNKYLVLVTDFNKNDNQALFKIKNKLNHSVFVADKFIVNRFEIKALPSIAFQDGKYLKVNVFALKSKSKKKIKELK